MSNMPTGFVMNLAQDTDAMERFSALSTMERDQIVSRARQARSKAEMQAIVRGI